MALQRAGKQKNVLPVTSEFILGKFDVEIDIISRYDHFIFGNNYKFRHVISKYKIDPSLKFKQFLDSCNMTRITGRNHEQEKLKQFFESDESEFLAV